MREGCLPLLCQHGPQRLVVMMSDLQIDQLNNDCAEKALELDRLKDELEKCDNQRLDLSEQLGILSADKNVAATELKTSRTEAARLKKELEVY